MMMNRSSRLVVAALLLLLLLLPTTNAIDVDTPSLSPPKADDDSSSSSSKTCTIASDGGDATTCDAAVATNAAFENQSSLPGFTDRLNEEWGVKQWIDFANVKYTAQEVVEWTIAHMLHNSDDPRCRNELPLCTYYAANDECDLYWSVHNCGPACRSCDRLKILLDGGQQLNDIGAVLPQYEPNGWGEPQHLGGTDEEERTLIRQQLDRTRVYMMTEHEHTVGCRNQRNECAFWAASGECEANPRFMEASCAPECQTCEKIMPKVQEKDESAVEDDDEDENEEAVDDDENDEAVGEDEDEEDIEDEDEDDIEDEDDEEVEDEDTDNEDETKDNEEKPEEEPLDVSPESFTSIDTYIPIDDEDPPEFEEDAQPAGGVYVMNDWGVPQHVGDDTAESVYQQLAATRKYMTEEVLIDEDYEYVRDKCVNKQRECAYWASIGECENESSYMMTKCAPECQTCDSLPYDMRCPFTEEDQPKALKPGDLHNMFERIVADKDLIDKHGPLTILSSPNTTAGPWVIMLDNFLSGEECDRFIDIGREIGYERSYEVGAMNFDGSTNDVINEGRTSTNSWCDEKCTDGDITKGVYPRMTKLTGISTDHSEHVQLLRYEIGQKYYEHHDYISVEKERMGGPRILTVFMYLNNVEAGGGTRFGRLNVTVTPKRGRVVMWPSVLNGMPHVMDPRTHHEALPVESGEKYGANAWIHLRNWTHANSLDC